MRVQAGLFLYASTQQEREGRRDPIAPFTNNWMLAAGAAHQLGENSSQFESRMNTK
jgi:hypothetical protein